MREHSRSAAPSRQVFMYVFRLLRQNNADGTVTLSGPCAITGAVHAVTVSAAQLAAYEAGALVQHAFPDLAAAERMFLSAGVSPAGNPWLSRPEGE